MVIRRSAVVLATLVGCVGCDQSTKQAAKFFLDGHGTVSLFADILRLGYAENAGGFLGMGSALPQSWRTAIFLAAVLVVVAALCGYAVTRASTGRAVIVGLALVIGGGLGNVIDRIFNDGRVIDFLNIGIGSVRTGIFNVADMAVMLGALMVVYSAHAPAAGSLSGPKLF